MSATHPSFRYILEPFGLGCDECDYLKDNMFPTLVPLLEELVRIGVEINTFDPDDPTVTVSEQAKQVLAHGKVPNSTIPNKLFAHNHNPIQWLAAKLKDEAQKKKQNCVMNSLGVDETTTDPPANNTAND
eukprot:TRINITY_DN59399_c0_g1_i1.p1 TRINITY_DN59399_c0_g1~~TRINITY_DN59399_c0_g1_i1.p1  ORF type:complete len:130 (-),score=13.27 TRINITY_DN59399_c0_g1_i1:226-615(-)